MGVAFHRVYVDISSETREQLKALCEARGMTQKALIAALIEDEHSRISQQPKTRGKKRGNT